MLTAPSLDRGVISLFLNFQIMHSRTRYLIIKTETAECPQRGQALHCDSIPVSLAGAGWALQLHSLRWADKLRHC